MKRICFLCTIFCLAFACYGQLEWTSNLPRDYDVETYLLSKKGQHILSLSHHPDIFEVAVVVDSEGNEVFLYTEHEFNHYLHTVSDIIELSDSSIVFPTFVNFTQGSFHYLTVRYDQNWENPVWEYVVFVWAQDIKGHGLSDNSYIVYALDGQQIARLDDSGQEIWKKHAGINPDYYFNDLTVTSGDLLVWAGHLGLALMDVDGNLDTILADFQFERIQTTSYDGFVGLWQDALYLVSTDFEPLHGFSFGGSEVVDYKVGHGKVAALTSDKMVYLFTDSLALLDSFPLLEESDFQQIDIGPDRLSLSGKEWYGTGLPVKATQANFIKEYSFSGENYGLSNDVGVVDIQTGTPTAVITFPDHHEIHYGEMQVTVQNFGDNPVDSLFLRFRKGDPFDSESFYQLLSKHYTDLSLQPNETVVLDWEGFKLKTNVGTGNAQEVCIWTSHPDRRLDANSANDGFCTDFLVNSKEAESEVVFNVFPNPSQQGSLLVYEGMNNGRLDVKVFNNLGMQIFQNGLSYSTGTLPLPKYPAGLYYISLLQNGKPLKTLKYVQLE